MKPANESKALNYQINYLQKKNQNCLNKLKFNAIWFYIEKWAAPIFIVSVKDLQYSRTSATFLNKTFFCVNQTKVSSKSILYENTHNNRYEIA